MPRQEKYIICSAAAAAAAAAAVVAAALSFFQASRKTEREACRPLREGGRQGGGVGVGVSGTILLACFAQQQQRLKVLSNLTEGGKGAGNS